MRILGWTLDYWNDEAHARRLNGRWDSLPEWAARITRLFKPVDLFAASGTWSDPRWNPAPSVKVVNAGAPNDKPYDYHCNHYGACAFAAALFYALNRDDWDYLVFLDTDTLVGAVNFPALFAEFNGRPETLVAPGWLDGIGGPFMAWKRPGVVKLAHSRLYPNISVTPRPKIWERECRDIYGKDWWNPWPQHNTVDMRHDSGANPTLQDWPFVSRPAHHVMADYLREKASKVVPLQ
jgi:hypothetical protein